MYYPLVFSFAVFAFYMWLAFAFDLVVVHCVSSFWFRPMIQCPMPDSKRQLHLEGTLLTLVRCDVSCLHAVLNCQLSHFFNTIDELYDELWALGLGLRVSGP